MRDENHASRTAGRKAEERIMMTRPKGKLLDCSGIVSEYGVSQWTAEKWMQQLPKVAHPGGVRKVFIYRVDLDRLLKDAEQAA
jgi:hypothetical protein